jgi:indole-3-acetate monooxygenase
MGAVKAKSQRRRKIMTSVIEQPKIDVLEAVERIRPVIEGYRQDGERERRLPEAVIIAMQEEGLFDLWLPKEYGGQEVDLTTLIATVEAISSIDGAAGWTFANMAAGASLTAYLPEAGAREMFASGGLGAGSGAPKGRAVPVEGGYRVSGRWPLTSGCHHADWLGGNCLIFDGEAPRLGPTGAPVFQLMFFPIDECSILDTWYSTGMRGTGSADYAVENVFVPEQRTFEFFSTPPRVAGALYRMGVLVLLPTALANVGLGIARAAIDAFVDLAATKTPTMSQTGLAIRSTVHAEVARAEALLQSARAFMHEVAGQMTAAVSTAGNIPPDLEARRRLACVHAAESCERVVDMMYRLGGATSIYSGHALDRCLRDIHTTNQHTFLGPVWWEKTGQFYFGQALGMP